MSSSTDSTGGSSAADLQARAEAMQKEAQQFQVMILGIQTQMDEQDKAFHMLSDVIDKTFSK